MSIDKYLNRVYDRRNYNCGHFAADVWFDLTGHDISEAISGLVRPTGKGVAILSELRKFHRINTPEAPCIAMLNPPRGQAHVGIYIRGKILHLSENGVNFDFLEVAASGFHKVRFYKC